MASIFDPQPAPVFTRDGRDGFCSEAEFENILAEYILGLNPRKREKALMTQAMYDSILHTLTHPNNTRESTAQFRFWTKKMFRLVTTAHAQIVTHENRPVAVREQIYDVLVQCHSQCSHGGRDKTSNQVRRYYSWIPKELIARFVKACPLCAVRRQTKTGGQFGYTESTAGDSNSNSASSPSDAAPLSAPDSAQTTPSHVSAAAAGMQGHYRYPHQQQLPRRSSYTGSIPPAELPPMPIPDSTGSVAEWSEWVNSTPVRPGANSQQISPASSVPRHLRDQHQHLQLQHQYQQQQQQQQQKEVEDQVRHEQQQQQQQQEQQHHEQYMQQLQYRYQMQMLQQQHQQMYPHLSGQYQIGAQTEGTTITIDTANGTDVFTIIPDDSAQPYVQPHEMQQYQDWSEMPNGQSAGDQSGHHGPTSQCAIDPGLLPPPTAPAYERRRSFDSVLTVDGSDSGSNSKDAPSLPPTPTLDSLDQATSAEFDADVQQLKEAVDEYFLNYPQGGSDVVSQTASLEGLEGLALLQNVVAMTSEDLTRSASRSSNRATGSRDAESQRPGDAHQVQITLQSTDSASGAELVGGSTMYTDHHRRSASPAHTFQPASIESSQHCDSSTHSYIDNSGRDPAAGSANASFESDGSALSIKGSESEETSRAPSSAENRVRQRPPALDLSAFTNNPAFLDPNNYNAAMYGSISGSMSAPAHVTQFLQPTFPIISPTDESALQAAPYYGTGTDWLSAPGHAAGMARPASSMGLLQPRHFDASPTSPTGTASSCALSYSSSTSSTAESLSASSTGSQLSPPSGTAPKESGRTFFVPPLSMMPAIHSAPFFQMPLSTQQQAAVSRELSDSIQNLLENTQPNAGARPEKRARIDPHYRRLLADLHRP